MSLASDSFGLLGLGFHRARQPRDNQPSRRGWARAARAKTPVASIPEPAESIADASWLGAYLSLWEAEADHPADFDTRKEPADGLKFF